MKMSLPDFTSLQKPTRLEFAALCFAGLVTVGIAYLHTIYPEIYPVDYAVYRRGDGGFYYPYWTKFFLIPFTLLPFWIGYIFWSWFNIAAIFISARMLRGNAAIALFSYQMAWNIYYGQIVGLVVLGMAITYYAARNNRPLIAGIGLAMALIKPQLGIAVLLTVVTLFRFNWRAWLLLWIPVLVMAALSFVVYGNWIAHILSLPTPNYLGSVSLWNMVGIWGLLLWIPGLFFPLTPMRRFILYTALVALTMPYFQQSGLLALVVMPIGWFGLLANLGYVMGLVGWSGLQYTLLLPIAVIIWVWWRRNLDVELDNTHIEPALDIR